MPLYSAEVKNCFVRKPGLLSPIPLGGDWIQGGEMKKLLASVAIIGLTFAGSVYADEATEIGFYDFDTSLAGFNHNENLINLIKQLNFINNIFNNRFTAYW